MKIVPPDTSTIYAAGTAAISAYQTSGMNEGKPMNGQGDSFDVTLSSKEITPQIIDGLMARMNAATADIPSASTGTIVAINQKSAGSFNINLGNRGDSPALLVKIDAQGNPQVLDLFDTVKNPVFNEFGDFNRGDANNIGSVDVKLKDGEKIVVIVASDGLSEGYFARKDISPRQNLNNNISAQIIQALKSGADISKTLVTGAHKTGHEDNATVLTVALDSRTDLKNKSLLLGVFDGLGHSDNSVSSELARQVGQILPSAIKPEVSSQRILPHISQQEAALTSRFTAELITATQVSQDRQPAVAIPLPQTPRHQR